MSKPLQIQPPQTVEAMTETQIDELLDMETYLTVFQLTFLMKAASSPGHQVPLWGCRKLDNWAQGTDTPLYHALTVLEELQLREFQQTRELESQKLIRLLSKGKSSYWQLTARGHLVVVWNLRTLSDYQALIPMTGNA